MGLYRRLNDVEDSQGIEEFAAELIDRFGKLPEPTENLLRVIEIKLNAKKACIAKIDVGPRVRSSPSTTTSFPNVAGLLAYVDKLGNGEAAPGHEAGHHPRLVF
jgi:transcription-repair coupling factor (superfamily II helicase)